MVSKLNTFQLKRISYESAMPYEKLKMTWEKSFFYHRNSMRAVMNRLL